MNEELEPLGLPMPSPAEPRSLSELITQYPLLALAASAAVGAGAVALIAAAVQRRDAGPESPRVDHVATQVYEELRQQLGKLAERVNSALPSGDDLAHTVRGLGGEASKFVDSTLGAAKQSLGGAVGAGKSAVQVAAAHPVLTSMLLGALGAAAASLSSSRAGDTSQAPGSPG